MARESKKAKLERALEIAKRMNEHYPEAECALHYWGDPFKLTIAVLLSAQTTDKGVNKVTPASCNIDDGILNVLIACREENPFVGSVQRKVVGIAWYEERIPCLV